MKLNIYLLVPLAIALALALVGCESSSDPDPEPEVRTQAAWSWQASGLTVQFTNDSKNAKFYSWGFGDLSPVSSVESPVHSYSTAGSYTVRLKACPSEDLTADECSIAEGVIEVSDIIADPEPSGAFEGPAGAPQPVERDNPHPLLPAMPGGGAP